MKKTRKVIYLGLAICLIASLLAFGCAKPAPQKEVTLRLTCQLPITHFITGAMELFKQEVEAGTNGLVKVELFPGGELYKHGDVPLVVPSGAIEMGIATGHFASLNPFANMLSFYFLIKTSEQWFEARDTVVSCMDKVYERYNLKFITPLYYGEAALAATKLLRVPADAKGLRIRGPTKGHLDCIATWGAIGISLSAGEVYDALGKGAIDGVCTGWSSHGARGHYEVADYFSGPTLFSVWWMAINLDTWNSLSKDTQRIILQAGEAAEKFTKDGVVEQDEMWIAKIKESGANVHFLTPEELAEWTKVTSSVYAKWVAECTEAGSGDEAIETLKALKVEGY